MVGPQYSSGGGSVQRLLRQLRLSDQRAGSRPSICGRRPTHHLSALDDFLDGVDAAIEEMAAQQGKRAVVLGANVDAALSANKANGGLDATISSAETADADSRNGWAVLKEDDGLVVTQHPAQDPSPVEQVIIRGRTVHLKRDDLLRLDGSQISGNKARKMWTLNRIPPQEFPRCLVSSGGPQSNSMVALAAVVNYKNRESMETKNDGRPDSKSDDNEKGASPRSERQPIRFVYYTKKLPRFLRNQPSGNLYRAQTLGMELIELTQQQYSSLFEDVEWTPQAGEAPRELAPPIAGESLWVPQGGAFGSARAGAFQLAKEIWAYWQDHGEGRPLTVCIPGGTCTTAVLVHHGLQKLLREQANGNLEDGRDDEREILDMDIEVVVIPCVGDAVYARRQMMALSVQIGADPQDIPVILQPGPEDIMASTTATPRSRYFTFAQPDKEILEAFDELRNECDVVVDLIYGAAAFAILFRHWNDEAREDGRKHCQPTLSPDLSFDPNHPLAGREIMYVHSGGVEGINSQLLRYQYQGLVGIQDIQLPGKRGLKSRSTDRI